MGNKKSENELIVSVLSYLLIGIIWYFVDDSVKSSLSKFHVKQALNIFIIAVVLNFLFSAIGILTFGILLIVLAPAYLILQIILFVLWLIGLIYAAQSKQEYVPIIGKFAEKYLKF